jgi:hypothetical protein
MRADETKFEKWLRKSGWMSDRSMNVRIARDAWDAAISECSKLVEEKFDPESAWITVDEIGELSS